MEELKEDMCHLEVELSGTREYSFRVNPADMNAIQFQMLLCDEPILAPLTFFCPGFITMATSGNVVSQKIKVSHPEDSLDDVTLLEGKKELIQGVKIVSMLLQLKCLQISKRMSTQFVYIYYSSKQATISDAESVRLYK